MLSRRYPSLIHNLSHNVPQQRLHLHRSSLLRNLVYRQAQSQIKARNIRLQSTSSSPYINQGPPPKRFATIRRVFSFTFRSALTVTFFFALGAGATILFNTKPIKAALRPVSDAETLTTYHPADPTTADINTAITTHPLAVSLRQNPAFTESRPHLKLPPALRAVTLTGGTLAGPGRIVVPPLTFSEAGGKSLVSIFYLGDEVCGHPGIVHGGLLATLLDEGLARCCFPALPGKVGMTANLTINYRKPTRASGFFVLRAWTTKVDGRKAWVEGHIETLADQEKGETPLVLVDANALFISPRQKNGVVQRAAAAYTTDKTE